MKRKATRRKKATRKQKSKIRWIGFLGLLMLCYFVDRNEHEAQATGIAYERSEPVGPVLQPGMMVRDDGSGQTVPVPYHASVGVEVKGED